MDFSQSPSMEQKAFMFSIPVIFCIILFMLLYLFYLRKKVSTSSDHPPQSPASIRSSSFAFPTPILVPDEVGFGDLIDELSTVVVDEELKANDSVCCVCLEEFEMNEELIQVPSCKHVFHIDCIRNWFIINYTCPLCRCLVIDVDDNELVLPSLQRSPADLQYYMQLLHYNLRQEANYILDG